MDEGTLAAALKPCNILFEGTGNPHAGSMRGYQRLLESSRRTYGYSCRPLSYQFAYGRAAYSKGAVYLNQIRYIMSEEAFRSGMLRYHEEWKLKHPTDLDFIRLIRSLG